MSRADGLAEVRAIKVFPMLPLQMIHDLTWSDLPEPVQAQARLCVLDLLGIAAGGATTALSAAIRDHAAEDFSGPYPMALDGRGVSPVGYAVSLGMTIDALDGHDGYNPAKGHVGCGLLPGTLAFALAENQMDGEAFLTSIAIGYELGSRLALSLIHI